MRNFLVKRTRLGKEVRAVESFEEGDFLGVAVGEDLARIEGLEPTVFLGSDLVDVIRGNEGFFSEPPPFTSPSSSPLSEWGQG